MARAKKRSLLHILLSFVLVMGLLPIQAFATEDAVEQSENVAVEESYSTLTYTPYNVENLSNPAGAEYVPGEVLVVLQSDINAEDALESLDVNTIEVANIEQADVEEALTGSGVMTVQLKEGVSVAEGITALQGNSNIAYVQPNFIYHLPGDEANLNGNPSVVDAELGELSFAADEDEAVDSDPVYNVEDFDAEDYSTEYRPNDPFLTNLETYRYDENAWHLRDIKAFDAWDKTKTSGKVTVVVIDTGCNVNHEDLSANVLKDYAYDVVSKCKLTYDVDRHGTHVCGLVSAVANNGKGTAGSSYNAKLLPINVFQKYWNGYDYDVGASSESLYEAYDYFLSVYNSHPELNIRVVNMSLGGYNCGNDDLLLQGRIQTAQNKGIVTVCAGGNGDDDGNPITSNHYPSDFPECIAVTCLSTDGVSPTGWCDYNSNKDICAPGSYTWSTVPDSTSSYDCFSGTSMSSPVVAGVVAACFAVNPSLTVAQAKACITSTADPITVPSGRTGKYGSGKLNMLKAINKAISYGGGIVVGSGTSTSYGAPYGNYYYHSGAQMIYTAAEIGNACTINTIAFNVATASSWKPDNLKIYLGYTLHKNFSLESYAVNASSGMELVYSGSPTIGSKTGWNEIKLQTPFQYNGRENLVVAIYHTSSGPNYTQSLTFKCTSKPNMTLLRQGDSNSTFSTPSNTANFGKHDLRPNIRLGYSKLGAPVDTPVTSEPTLLKDTDKTVAATSGSTGYYAPYCNFYRYGGSKSVYTASEIGGKGTISSISFNVASASSLANQRLRVYLGHTSFGKDLTTTTKLNASDMTLVYDGAPTLGTSTGWETLTLSAPFAYNGIDNLAVLVFRESSSYTSGLKYATTSSGASVYRQSDSDTTYANPDTSGNWQTCNRPAFRVHFTSAASLGAQPIPSNPGTGSSTIVGSSDSSGYYAPYNNYYKNSTNQTIYTASELNKKAGKITAISYNVASASTLSTTSVKIYMGHTSSSTVSTSSPFTASGLTLVYNGAPTLGAKTGWEKITLSTPFQYNGTSNLLVIVCKQANDYTKSLKYITTNSGTTIYRQSDNNTEMANPNNTSYSYSSTSRPQTSFEFAASADPSNPGTSISGTTTFESYAGGNVVLVKFVPTTAITSGCPTWMGRDMYWANAYKAWITTTKASNLAGHKVMFNKSGSKTTYSVPFAQQGSRKPGDLNDNGKVNIVDAQLTYDIAIGKSKRDPDANYTMFLMADLNRDAHVDALDAFAVQRAALLGGKWQ